MVSNNDFNEINQTAEFQSIVAESGMQCLLTVCFFSFKIGKGLFFSRFELN
jgi:hypothetical protein